MKLIKLAVLGIGIPLVVAFVSASILIAQIPESPVHYHANFAIFTNGTLTDFAKPDFMHLKPCRDTPDAHASKLESIHLHDMVGNVVHVHTEDVRWSDFFMTVRTDILEDGKKLSTDPQFYLNGKKVNQSVLSKKIEKNDRLLVTYTKDVLPDDVNGNTTLQDQMNIVGDTAHTYDEPGTSGESCSGSAKRTYMQRLRIALNNLF